MNSSPKPDVLKALLEQGRHDLRPVLLGLRTAIELLKKSPSPEPCEILRECESRLVQVIDQLKLPGK